MHVLMDLEQKINSILTTRLRSERRRLRLSAASNAVTYVSDSDATFLSDAQKT